MKKKTRMKTKPVKVKKVKKIRPPVIPKGVAVTKKFVTKDKARVVYVMRLPNDDGYEVRSLGRDDDFVVRTFKVPSPTEVPTPVWSSALRELAIWYARHVIRKGVIPGERSERSRRKKYIRRALRSFQSHQETKTVVQRLSVTRLLPPVKKPKLQQKMPWVFVYDPQQRCGETTFRVHAAYCSKLSRERVRVRKVLRKKPGGGDTWVVEARTQEEAIQFQLVEFNAEDKGYDRSDFTIHECRDASEKRVLGKTVLGKVGRSRR